jgi:uncharacterized repeat protein (TIGR02543 family)
MGVNDFECWSDVQVLSDTNTEVVLRVLCYWKCNGNRYSMNNVFGWVSCNGSEDILVFADGVDFQDNQGLYLLGYHDFTIQKGNSAFNCESHASLESQSSYVQGYRQSGSDYTTISAKPSYTVSYNANGGSGAPGNQAKIYGTNLTLSNTRPTRTGYNFVRWNTASNGSGTSYNPGGTYSNNAAVTLYAIWTPITYTVSYNANGGSGAPGSQTKTYGVNLTLSSTKPTRTGYNFVRWNTAANGSGTNYNSGGTYSANSAVTLYAIWTPITYTVSYNANGGSGAPANQTKTYGANLTLSSTKPTRTNYNFKGWATSASGSVAYQPGGTYSNNAAITLYAIWELAYIKPRITNLQIYRCDSSGNEDATGSFIKTVFNWATDKTGALGKLRYKKTTDSSWLGTVTLFENDDNKSGSVNNITGNSSSSSAMYFNPEYTYIAQVYVEDSQGSSYRTESGYYNINTAKYPIDIKSEGKGIAFGKVAETEDSFDIGFKNIKYFNENLIWKDNNNKMHLMQSIIDILWPIGSIYLSIDTNNPSTKFGGTWTKLEHGFLYAAEGNGGRTGNGTGTTTGAASGNTGKASGNTGSTTLTIDQIPSHTHKYNKDGNAVWQQITGYGNIPAVSSTGANRCNIGGTTTQATGGGKGHSHSLNEHTHSLNNHTHAIPYVTVSMWQRTA